MAKATTEKQPDERPTGSKLWRAPFVGIVVVVIMLLEVPLPEAVKDLWSALNTKEVIRK